MSQTEILDRRLLGDLMQHSGSCLVPHPVRTIQCPRANVSHLPSSPARYCQDKRGTRLPRFTRLPAECLDGISPQYCLPQLSMPSMAQPPSRQSVLSALGTAIAPATIDRIQAVSPPRLRRSYEIHLPGNRRLALVMSPPTVVRLLRSERLLTISEAAVVRWLTDVIAREQSPRQPDLNFECDTESRALGDTSDRPSENIHRIPTADTRFLQLFPSLLVDSKASDNSLGAPYNVLECPRGTPVSLLRDSLTSAERSSLDFQTGKLMRQLSTLSCNTKKFGSALAVLGPDPKSHGLGGAVSVDGTGTWSMAFHSLLESILRDGEDMTIVLPYSTIRRQFRRLAYLLDTITIPRLVVIDAADDTNLLITLPKRLPTPPPKSPRTGIEAEKGESTTQKSDSGTALEDDKSRGTTPVTIAQGDDIVAVTGLRDWSSCVFGDPLLASAFCDEPSDDLLRGFHSNGAGVEREEMPDDVDLIEDEEMAPVRTLLYRVYHTTVQIVKEFYRPTDQSSKRELTARKKLIGILATLEQVEDPPKRRHRRPSGDMSPAKKPKSSHGTDEDEGAEG